MRFVDTNVLLYALTPEPDEAMKSRRAMEILNEPDLALSTQVLQEFYVQATRTRRSQPLAPADATAFIEKLLRYPIQETTVALLRSALAAKVRWQISYWDAAIVEAARALGCAVLYSEDLHDGQDLGGVRVLNPFL